MPPSRFPLVLLLAVACAATCLGASAALAAAREPPAQPDWTARWARLLDRHTRSVDAKVGTRVDYRALSAEPAWPLLLAEIDAVDPRQITTRDEQLAFWINVYNVFAIDVVLNHHPVESIKDVGSFFRPVWKRPAGRIAGREYSLDEVEHEILRPLGEPRIHGAIVCASVSCPDLRREPYRAETLDAQLDDNMRAWLARPEKGLALDRDRRELTLSPIFDWFEDDFAASGGVLAVATRYAPEAERQWLEGNRRDVEIEYFDYDWRLNE